MMETMSLWSVVAAPGEVEETLQATKSEEKVQSPTLRQKLEQKVFRQGGGTRTAGMTVKSASAQELPDERDYRDDQKTMRQPSILVPGVSDDVVSALDARYFTESFDPLAYVLEQIPDDRSELDEFLESEISAVDLAKDEIVTQLSEDVHENQDAFIQGMKHVQEVDLDIARAHIHVKNGRRLLSSTKDDMVLSSLDIVKKRCNRERVHAIVCLGERIRYLFEEEQRMTAALDSRDLITAVDICLSLRHELTEDDVKDLDILRHLRTRVEDFIPELRRHFDLSLEEIAQAFDSVRYKELLQAYMTLAKRSETESLDFASYRLHDVFSTIPQVFVRYVDSRARYLVEKSLPAVSSATNNVAVASSSLNSKRQKQSANQIVQQIQDAFRQLTELLHTYYLLVQWHRDPMNPQNDDVKYLHRCGIDDDDDEEETEDEVDESRSPRSGRKSDEMAGEDFHDVLCDTGVTLLRYRKIVWENMQQSVLEMLERLDLTFGFQMDHVISLSKSTHAFADVGQEFIGAPVAKLRSVLRVKTEQYLHALHDDNMESCRMLIDADNWSRVHATTVEYTDSSRAALLGLIQARSGHDMTQVTTRSKHPLASTAVFPSFETDGNPFDKEQMEKWLNPSTTVINVESEENPDEVILTSSLLSGLLRYCGIYLKIMQHLPSINWDAFLSLGKHIELYAYAVFTTFASPVQMQQLFVAPSSFIHDDIRYPFTTLRNSMHRISKEMRGEVMVQCSATLYRPNAEEGKIYRTKKIELHRVIRDLELYGTENADGLSSLVECAVACESVVSQIQVLHAIEPLLRKFLSKRHHVLLDEVVERHRRTAYELREWMIRATCLQVIDKDWIVGSIRAMRWDEKELDDQPHDFMLGIVERCGHVWGRLDASGLPGDVCQRWWTTLVQVVMESLLEGFATVTECSLHGRARMTVDLYALQNGLEAIHHVSRKNVSKGIDHVNAYVKAFYCSEDELVEWIRQHKDAYSRYDLVHLIRNGIGQKLDTVKLKALVKQVESILDDKASASPA